MKIFAMNLCLDFALSHEAGEEGEPIRYADLMGLFFKGTDIRGQVFHLQAETKKAFSDNLFELQQSPLFRELDATVRLHFRGEQARDEFLSSWLDRFKRVEAAGGLVQNEKGEYLCIYNRDRWTLPKGHVEWREAPQAAAQREVTEETGAQGLRVISELSTTYHTFRMNHRWILKITHWYRMSAPASQQLRPQLEEGIEKVAWLNRAEWLSVADESYPWFVLYSKKNFPKA